jgi:glycosyltransferase involved in cell wall biosynthesis
MAELLESMTRQTFGHFEVIIVEDGSTTTCETVVEHYADKLHIDYHKTPNGGPGLARNRGAARARGEYLIFLDSDCILPPHYIIEVHVGIVTLEADAFGGPDRASADFTPVQKAINYSMTSFLTTGGIRGGKRELEKFHPRSFNMGIRREVYETLHGFSAMRFGEDIDFSIRLYEAGCRVKLFPAAWVYHKRRTDWKKFWRQVYNSGIARINLYEKHPRSLKPVHLMPAGFTLGTAACIAGTPFVQWAILPPLIFAASLCIDSAVKNKSLKIGLLSVVASYIQLVGYGCGFLSAAWNRIILKKGEYSAFNKTFYD